jgi:hypothetical protein
MDWFFERFKQDADFCARIFQLGAGLIAFFGPNKEFEYVPRHSRLHRTINR